MSEVIEASWQVQEAKQRFSEVLRAVETGGPQMITRHGREIAVIIDIHEYHRLRGRSVSFMDYLHAEPHLDAALEAEFAVERPRDLPRELDLAG